MTVQTAGDIPSPGFIVAACLASLPILAVMVWGAVKIFGPVSQAFARWITSHGGGGEESRLELEGLRLRVEALEGQVAEAQERLDFTERMLTRATGAGAERLPSG